MPGADYTARVTKKKRPTRTRTLRRNLERSEDKLAQARRRLLALEPGGVPEHPIALDSAAVIEARAESVLCPDCEGPLRVSEHSAETHEGTLLRRVTLACRRCGAPLVLFFRVVVPLAN
jgi:hypothetical protein